jgi:hypothetical protein
MNIYAYLIYTCKYTNIYEYMYMYTGLQPDTVVANISGSIRDFWGLLNDQVSIRILPYTLIM